MKHIESTSVFKIIEILAKFTIFCSLLYGPSSLAMEVKIGIGSTIPPYVLVNENAGIEVDIIREAFKAKGYTTDFVYLPNLRIPMLLGSKELDGASVNAAYKMGKDFDFPLYNSDTTITFQNYAIALRRKQYDIKSIKDLANKNILAFQNATQYLGQDYSAMAKSNKHYKETSKQYLQVRNLMGDRTDVVISDKNIFLYWKKKAGQKTNWDVTKENTSVRYYDIFPKSPRDCKFRNKNVRDDFNNGLKLIHQNGTYEKILDKYSK